MHRIKLCLLPADAVTLFSLADNETVPTVA